MLTPLVPEPGVAVPLASPPIPCPACAAEAQRLFRPGDPAARPQVARPEDAAALVIPFLIGRDREHCLLVTLDVKHRLIGVQTVSVGTADHTFMAPREVFRDALLAGASAVFVAHNHPSGDSTPSADDRQITRRLAQAGAVLGVDLLDHLVIGDPEWVSLARLGVL
jgi:DNA repair protein RadC